MGAAFILIPVFIALGIDIHVAMATALLLNSIAMVFASWQFMKKKLIMWKVALPILIVATILSPPGAYVSTKQKQVKMIIGIVLLTIAAKMIWDLLG